MKKYFILLYLIILNLIIIVMFFNNGSILYNNKITLKSMNESTQVTDLNKSINELESSHEEYQNYIQEKKTNLATAITNAGVITSRNDTFETITSNVSKILANKTNDATATEGEILIGKTAYVKGTKIIGTMKDNKAVSPSALNAGGSYTIPAGYHNGSGKVTVNSLASQTQANATADNITAGKTAWVNGTLITGNGADNLASQESSLPELYFPSIFTCTFPSDYGSGGSSFRIQNLQKYTKLVLTEGSSNTAGVYIYGYSNNTKTTLFSSSTTISARTIDITNYDGIEIYLNCYVNGSSIYGTLNNVYIRP